MATHTYRRWGGTRPNSTADTQLVASGAGDQMVGVVNICNQSAGALTYRVAIQDGAAPYANSYIAYDVPLPANGAHQITCVCLGNSQQVIVRASLADSISFVFMGLKIT